MSGNKGGPGRASSGDGEDHSFNHLEGRQQNSASSPGNQPPETRPEPTAETEADKTRTIQQLQALLEKTRTELQQLQLQQRVSVEGSSQQSARPEERRQLPVPQPALPQRPSQESRSDVSTHGIRPVQAQQLPEGTVVDDRATLRIAHPRYDSKLVLPDNLRTPDLFEQAQAVCDDLTRLSRNDPERLGELQNMQRRFESEQKPPQGLSDFEYDIIANLFESLVGAYHHEPSRHRQVTDMIANYQTDGPESLPEIPDFLDIQASDFESFRNSLVDFSESHLSRQGRVVAEVLRCLSASNRNLNMNPGCLTGSIEFDTGADFGYFLAIYSRGKLSKLLKSVIFNEKFYLQFVCPQAVGNKTLPPSDRREAEWLMRILLSQILRVQVSLVNGDIENAILQAKFQVQIQISVSRLFIPKTEADEQSQKLFENLFQPSFDVRTTYKFASTSQTTDFTESMTQNIPDRDHPVTIEPCGPSQTEITFGEALATAVLRSTRNGILSKFYPGDNVTVSGHKEVGVVIDFDHSKEELQVALPSGEFWVGSSKQALITSNPSILPVPGDIVYFTHGERVTKHGLVAGFGVLESFPNCDKREAICDITTFTINSETVSESVEAGYFHIKRTEERKVPSNIRTEVQRAQSDPNHFKVGNYIAICDKPDVIKLNDYIEAETVDKQKIKVRVTEYGRVVKRSIKEAQVRIEVFRLPNVCIDISWLNVRRANKDEAIKSQTHYETIYSDLFLLEHETSSTSTVVRNDSGVLCVD